MTTSSSPRVYPPPPFGLIHTHVNSELFGIPFPAVGPWGFSIVAPNVGAANNNYMTLSTYLRGTYAQATTKFCSPLFPTGFSLSFVGTRSKDGGVAAEPSVVYKFKKGGDNTLTFSPLSGSVNHTYAHAEGAMLTDVTTEAYDRLSTKGSLNARLYPGLTGGFDFTYDPSRSGLKNYRLGLKYLGTHSLSYEADGRTWAASTIYNIVAGRLQLATYATMGRKGHGATVGIIGFSPCGAKMVGKLSVSDGKAGLGMSRVINGEWRVNLGVHGNAYKRTYEGVGVSFTYEQ